MRLKIEDSPDKYSLVADVKTIYGVRTIALDPKTHHIFTIGTGQNNPVPPTEKNPNPRPRPVPSTFQVLEINKSAVLEVGRRDSARMVT